MVRFSYCLTSEPACPILTITGPLPVLKDVVWVSARLAKSDWPEPQEMIVTEIVRSIDTSGETFTVLLEPLRRVTAYGDTAAAMGMSTSAMVDKIAEATSGEFEKIPRVADVHAPWESTDAQPPTEPACDHHDTTRMKSDTSVIECWRCGQEVGRDPQPSPPAPPDSSALATFAVEHGLTVEHPSDHHTQIRKAGKVLADWWPGKGTVRMGARKGPSCKTEAELVAWLKEQV